MSIFFYLSALIAFAAVFFGFRAALMEINRYNRWLRFCYVVAMLVISLYYIVTIIEGRSASEVNPLWRDAFRGALIVAFVSWVTRDAIAGYTRRDK